MNKSEKVISDQPPPYSPPTTDLEMNIRYTSIPTTPPGTIKTSRTTKPLCEMVTFVLWVLFCIGALYVSGLLVMLFITKYDKDWQKDDWQTWVTGCALFTGIGVIVSIILLISRKTCCIDTAAEQSSSDASKGFKKEGGGTYCCYVGDGGCSGCDCGGGGCGEAGILIIPLCAVGFMFIIIFFSYISLYKSIRFVVYRIVC